ERLALEVDRLGARVRNQAIQYQMAREEWATASAVEKPEEPAPERSPDEERQERISYHVQAFESQARADYAADDFEVAVHDGFASIEHSELQDVECRATKCRIEIVHFGQHGRDRFSGFVLGRGPLKYGTFDYSTADGTR